MLEIIKRLKHNYKIALLTNVPKELMQYLNSHIISSEIRKSKEVADFAWLTLREIKKHKNLEPAMLDFLKDSF